MSTAKMGVITNRTDKIWTLEGAAGKLHTLPPKGDLQVPIADLDAMAAPDGALQDLHDSGKVLVRPASVFKASA